MRHLIDLVEGHGQPSHALIERVQRPDVNSLGRPIADTPEALANFWVWFGRSKIIDRVGRPLVLYHGTTADFRAFDAVRSTQQVGPSTYVPSFFFTQAPDVAQSYARQQTHPEYLSPEDSDLHHQFMVSGRYDDAVKLRKTRAIKNYKTWGDGAHVMPVYLRMERPLRASGKGNFWNEIWFEGDYITTRDLTDIAVDRGCDGIIVKNVHDRGNGTGKPSTIYAVFNPSQIKSALTNSGAFGAHDLIDENARQNDPG